jgi:hypothetical protein
VRSVKRSISVVDVEHVAAVHAEVADAGDIDVEPPVAVDVGHRDPGLPALGVRHTGVLGDILEAEVPRVAIETVGPQVRREVQVRQAVAIDVSGRYAAAVVVVQVVQDVERRIFGQRVDERDTARFWWDRDEQGPIGGSLTTRACQHPSEQDQPRGMTILCGHPD